MELSKGVYRTILDVRFLGSFMVVLFALARLFCHERTDSRTPPRLARGEPAVQVTSFSLSAVENRIVTTNTDGRIAVRSSASEWQIERILKFPGFAYSVAMSPHGERAVAVGISPQLCVWDLASCSDAPAATISLPIRAAVHVAYSPEGGCIAVTSADSGWVGIYRTNGLVCQRVLLHPSIVSHLAFSPDGRLLATTGRDDWSVLLWDLSTGMHRTMMKRGNAPVKTLAFSADGTLLATARVCDRQIQLWNFDRPGYYCTLATRGSFAKSIAFSSDNKLLASASNDGFIEVWDLSSRQRQILLDTQASSLCAIAFTSDQQAIALATRDDDDIRFWNLAELTGRNASSLPGQDDRAGDRAELAPRARDAHRPTP